MGMLTKLLGLKLAQKVVSRLDARADAKDAQLRQQYIAAGEPVPADGSWRTQGVVRKAGRFYQKNPKLVASLVTVVLAGLAAALAKKRRMY